MLGFKESIDKYSSELKAKKIEGRVLRIKCTFEPLVSGDFGRLAETKFVSH
jgi:hypothetical protein